MIGKLTEQWVKETIVEFIAIARENHLSDFRGQKIYDNPVIGIVDHK